MTITHDGAAGRMSGVEHYREAERLAVTARTVYAEDAGAGALVAAVAQVHATLAMAWMPPTPAVVPPAYPRLWVGPDAWGTDCVWLVETAADEDRPELVAQRHDYLPYMARDDDAAEVGR